MMERKRGLVCDSQKYFSRFIKYEFKEDLSFDVCRSFEDFDSGLNVYSIIVFVIYSEEELLDFIKVYKEDIPLIVCTFNNKILIKLKKIEGILLLDTSKIRSEIVVELRSYFNFINFIFD